MKQWNRQNSLPVWIGLYREKATGEWKWLDGSTTPIHTLNWSPGEPNNAGGRQNCAQIAPSHEWDDINCEWMLISGVCAKKVIITV